MDLRLFQRQIAEKIGVSEASIWSWERGTETELFHIPNIIEFLGYEPFECPEDVLGRLWHYKLISGLSYIRRKVMGRDPEQLTDWLTGRKQPCKKNLDFIMAFLSRGR